MKSFYEMLEILNKMKLSNEYVESSGDEDENEDGEDSEDRYDYEPEPPSEAELKMHREREYQRGLEAERRRLYPLDGKYEEKWNREVGKSPNGKKYNLVLHIYATTEVIADARVRKFEDFHWGAKHILDIRKSKSDNPRFPVLYKMYVQDNHAEGHWAPFKDEPNPGDQRDRQPPTAFDIYMAKEKGYEPKGLPIAIPPVLDENTLNEMQVTDPDLQEKIKEFAFLSDEIDHLKSELKTLEMRYAGIEEILRPILDELRVTGDKTLQVEHIIVTVKRAGHSRDSIGYKEACMYLLERVNASMKKIAQEAIDANTKTVQIATSIGVQKIESVFSSIGGFLGKIKNLWRGFMLTLRMGNSQIHEAIDEFHSQTKAGVRNEHKQHLENRHMTSAGHRTQGKLEEWIERNRQWINVKRGYGDCVDCVRVFLDPKAEDESRRVLADPRQPYSSSNLDLWGLYHLEDYVVTSRVSGNSVILMPLDEEGLVRKRIG